METILIKPLLLELAKAGLKTTTYRKGIRQYELGKAILKSNESDDFMYIDITEVKYFKLKDITDEIAESNGFKDKVSFNKLIKDTYEDINKESDVTIVCFNSEEANLYKEYLWNDSHVYYLSKEDAEKMAKMILKEKIVKGR